MDSESVCRIRKSHWLVQRGGDLDPARDAVGLHAGRNVDGVPKEPKARVLVPDDAGAHGAGVDPDPHVEGLVSLCCVGNKGTQRVAWKPITYVKTPDCFPIQRQSFDGNYSMYTILLTVCDSESCVCCTENGREVI